MKGVLDKFSIFFKSNLNIILFISFVLLLFAKSVLFHYFSFQSILISSFWKEPLQFLMFYVAKLILPFFIASFVFISKRYWWTFVISLFVDIWCISNLIYLKTYDMFLTVDTIFMAGNMNGAWSSILPYINWQVYVFLVLSFLWLALLILINKIANKSLVNKKRKFICFVVVDMFVILLAILNNLFLYGFSTSTLNQKITTEKSDDFESLTIGEDSDLMVERIMIPLIPFTEVLFQATDNFDNGKNYGWTKFYIRDQSIISYFPASIVYYMVNPIKAGDKVKLGPSDIDEISHFIPVTNNDSIVDFENNMNLIIVLVESLESWPLEKDIEGINVMPNLRKLISNEHVAYFDKIKSQTLSGNSGDGQMIINTGLLPITDGVACMHYGNNVYPNIAHYFKSSNLVNPWPHIWNQDTMSVRYSYKNVVEPCGVNWEDADVFNATKNLLKNSNKSSCTMAITVSTHVPFDRIDKNIVFSDDTPEIICRYLNCLHYTDSCIGDFIQYMELDTTFKNTVLLITGDHTVFKSVMFNEFGNYLNKERLSCADGNNYCPLILYSSNISENTYICDTCYQMDIYPTILGLIGIDADCWNGFGVNLLDSVSRRNRPISEAEAYRLSDFIIKSDYFETINAK